MAILIGFAPWIIFAILAGHGRMLEAASIAAIASLASMIGDIRKKRSIKVLQAGTLVFFSALTLAAFFADRAWLGRWTQLMSSSALAAITLVSIIMRRPFTIQYARESVPKEYWDTPEFFHANLVITWVWFAAFAVNTVGSAIRVVAPHIWSGTSWVISICTFVAAMKFTKWYSGKR
ncbi:MAG: hypothetical protein JW919_07220 [Candidatus Omnitrophica bacterium]|nr:hypothetical protein [Candidatus Omnitrophota bacterium]